MLIHIEKIVKEYLKREMKYDVETGGEFNVFAVEGATAAMCYIFDSLIANNLLLKGDKIAIMTPVFTPYLEIPHLPRYEFEVVYINADEIDENDEHTWQCSNKELEKLSNPDIKDKIELPNMEDNRQYAFIGDFIKNYLQNEEVNIKLSNNSLILETTIPGNNKYFNKQILYVNKDTKNPEKMEILNDEGKPSFTVKYKEFECKK